MPQEVELDLARAERKWRAGDKKGALHLLRLWFDVEEIVRYLRDFDKPLLPGQSI